MLVERSLLGWYEIEFEVLRDAAGHDDRHLRHGEPRPDGRPYRRLDRGGADPDAARPVVQRLRRCALKIVRALELEGGCNVQLAVAPDGSDYRVIEVNPRVSRSSALASKATGYPIARIAALVALGRRLHEMPNPATGGNSAAFEPAVDYVVVKLPRWPFDKFPTADRIARSADEGDRRGHGDRPRVRPRAAQGDPLSRAARARMAVGGRRLGARRSCSRTTSRRSWRRRTRACGGWSGSCAIGWTDAAGIAAATGIAPWFIERLAELVAAEREIVGAPLLDAKRAGFGDAEIAALSGVPPAAIRRARVRAGIGPSYRRVDTCAGEFPAETPYFYSLATPSPRCGRRPNGRA